MKRAFAFFVLGAMVVGSAGCGDDKKGGGVKAEGNPDPKVQGAAGSGTAGPKDKPLTPQSQ